MTTAIKDAGLVGTIAYGDFVFGGPGSTPPTYAISGKPVYDPTQRTVTHVQYRC